MEEQTRSFMEEQIGSFGGFLIFSLIFNCSLMLFRLLFMCRSPIFLGPFLGYTITMRKSPFSGAPSCIIAPDRPKNRYIQYNCAQVYILRCSKLHFWSMSSNKIVKREALLLQV